MHERPFEVYPYRWIVLAVFSLLNAVVQLNWITFAPITVDCIRLYHTTAFWIVLLSLSFMVVYLFVSFPASALIDRYGIRIGAGIGALLTGVFGYLRGAYADDYTMVAVSQFGLAAAQPFVLNAVTKVAAEWFPITERATATGITALAQFVGIIVAMAVTRPLAEAYLAGGEGAPLTLDAVGGALTAYGLVSVVVAALFLLLARDRPPTPPCREEEIERFGVLEGVRHIFKTRDMVILLVIFFVGLGMFNAITTFIDLILASKGYVSGGNEAGNVGAIMMIAGVFGAIIIPTLSDKTRRRRFFFIVCVVGVVPGLVGLTFVVGYVPLLVSSAIFGFFFMAAAPIGFQYAAEVSHPAPESTSQGMIVLSGQISGSIFIVLMSLVGNVSVDALADAGVASASLSLTPFMVFFIVLALVNLALAVSLRESSLIRSATG
jgi:MFS family permease